jgi:hypothetical protein
MNYLDASIEVVHFIVSQPSPGGSEHILLVVILAA